MCVLRLVDDFVVDPHASRRELDVFEVIERIGGGPQLLPGGRGEFRRTLFVGALAAPGRPPGRVAHLPHVRVEPGPLLGRAEIRRRAADGVLGGRRPRDPGHGQADRDRRHYHRHRRPVAAAHQSEIGHRQTIRTSCKAKNVACKKKRFFFCCRCCARHGCGTRRDLYIV